MVYKNIAIAADHAGYELKNELIGYLQKKGINVKDFGVFSPEPGDYPDVAHPLAVAVEKKEFPIGITICGSGNGINMTVNKHQGIRSAVCWSEEISRLARYHNDANICAIPARFISKELAFRIVDIFIQTGFEGGRHKRRIDKIPIR
jgi:ribose 5-phosphate isomerase B